MGINVLTAAYELGFSVTSISGISESRAGKLQTQKNCEILPVCEIICSQRCFDGEADKASGSFPCQGSWEGPGRGPRNVFTESHVLVNSAKVRYFEYDHLGPSSPSAGRTSRQATTEGGVRGGRTAPSSRGELSSVCI